MSKSLQRLLSSAQAIEPNGLPQPKLVARTQISLLFIRLAKLSNLPLPISVRHIEREPGRLREFLQLVDGLHGPGIALPVDREIRLRRWQIRALAQSVLSVDLGDLPPDPLGSLYEGHLARMDRDRRGVFYTPKNIADHLVSSISARLPRPRWGLWALDPACGSGGLLLALARHLSQLPFPVHLVGIDRDVRALEVFGMSTRLIGRTATTPCFLNPSWHLVRGDALVSSDCRKHPDPLDWHVRFPEVFRQGGFDLVLANPPWISHAGRQGIELPNRLRRYYGRHFRSMRWPTTHGFFAERCAQLTHQEGVMGLVLPDQVAHLDSYQDVREVFGTIEEVRLWGETAFSKVVSPTLTVISRPGDAQGFRALDQQGLVTPKLQTPPTESASRAPWIHQTGSARQLLAKVFAAQRIISVRPFLRDSGYRTTDATRQVVRLTSAESDLGVAVATTRSQDDLPRSGVCVLPTSSDRTTPTYRRKGSLPVLEGKQVTRYACGPAQIALLPNVGKILGNAVAQAPARFLVRQTARFPIVGPRPPGLGFRNSLLALHAPEQTWLDILVLVALLNSRLICAVYQALTHESGQRAFPQVKLGALGKLPMCIPPKKADRAALVRCAKALLCDPSNSAVDDELEDRIAVMYGVSQADYQQG